MLPDGGFRGLGRIRYYCSIIKSLYFKVNFQLLFQVSNMLYGGSSGVQCNSTGCWVFPELWSAGQPVKCNLTAFCPQPSTPIPGCTPWCFCTRHQWSCIWAMTLYNQLESLFSSILMSHFIMAENIYVQLWHPWAPWREGRYFIQSLLLPISITQPCVSPVPWVKWKINPVYFSYNKDQPRWTIRANGRQQYFLRIPLNSIDADIKFFPDTNIYTNEIKEKTKNANSRSNLKEKLVTLFTFSSAQLFWEWKFFACLRQQFVICIAISIGQLEGKLLLNRFLFLPQRLTALLY